jgi:hypothetical protein
MTLVKSLFEYGFCSQIVVRVDVSRNQEKNILKFEKTKQTSENLILGGWVSKSHWSAGRIKTVLESTGHNLHTQKNSLHDNLDRLLLLLP